MTFDILVGLYFFQTQTSSGPKSGSVNGASYGALLRKQFLSELRERDGFETTEFIQGGAPLHIAKSAKNYYMIPMVSKPPYIIYYF